VDAPLDDHHVDRFCDRLAERGVSQLVSVDLDTAARIREAV
jgi:chromosome segregation ATPase